MHTHEYFRKRRLFSNRLLCPVDVNPAGFRIPVRKFDDVIIGAVRQIVALIVLAVPLFLIVRFRIDFHPVAVQDAQSPDVVGFEVEIVVQSVIVGLNPFLDIA